MRPLPEQRLTVVIRADASVSIGSGHVMRCLTLAEAARARGAEIEFVCRAHPGNLNDLIRRAGFVVREISVAATEDSKRSPDASQQEDADATIGAVQGKRFDWLIVDHYGLDQTWESRMRLHARKLMVIDDLADRRHDCDLLLDQNFHLDGAPRYDGLISPTCTRLLGPRYALLRPEFADARTKMTPRAGRVRRVLVFFGGSDPANVTGRALEALSASDLGHLEVDVVVGITSPHFADLERQIVARPRTTLHVQVDNMAQLMARADLALGAGGSTTWERLCLGLPSLVVTIAENQNRFTEDLHREGLLTWIGALETVGVPELRQALSNAVDRSANHAAALKGMELVPVDGASRVANLLLHGVSPEQWVVRNATASDCELYWRWVNDPEVRRNSLHSEPIPWEAHQRWFHKKLVESDATLLLVVSEVGPIGQVRLDRRGSDWAINYSLARQFRGLGLGRRLLACAIETVKQVHVVTLLGEVKADNQASATVFQRLGFIEDLPAEPEIRRFRLRVSPVVLSE